MAVAFLVLGIGGTMTPVAFVLFAHEATHSYASASLVWRPEPPGRSCSALPAAVSSIAWVRGRRSCDS